jgi:hypothetical protein
LAEAYFKQFTQGVLEVGFEPWPQIAAKKICLCKQTTPKKQSEQLISFIDEGGRLKKLPESKFRLLHGVKSGKN